MGRIVITLNNRNIALMTCTILVSIVNALFCYNQLISYGTVVIQVLILAYLFIQKKYIDYLGMYILFCGLSMEYDTLAGSMAFYGFKNTRILGVNLGILSLIPLVFVSVRYIFLYRGLRFSKFYKFFMFLQGSALVIGILLIALNDNDICRISNVINLFVDHLYTMSIQQIFLIVIFVMLINTYESLEPLEDYFLCLMIGVVISLLVSRLFGTRGYYGGVQTLVVSNNARWLPMMLILPIYQKYKGKTFIWISGLVGAVLVLAYNATGKMVILYVFLPFIYIWINIKRKKYNKAILVLYAMPVVVFGLYFGAQKLAETSILFRSKMNQAMSLVNYFLGRIGTDDVSNSPRVRIYETGNILYEYLEKPWLLPLGKGFLGTVKNHTGMTYAAAGAYSDIQWNSGLFFRMHESVNKLLLTNGAAGLTFLISTIIIGIKNIHKTPWGAIGIYWLLICYGHSITMTAFGFSCLVYSIIQVDKQSESLMNRYRSEGAK